MRVLRIFHSGVVSAWRSRERQLRRLGHDVRLLSSRRWNEGGSDVTLVAEAGEAVTPVDTVGRHPALFLYDPRPIWRALGEEWDVLDIHEEPFALATAEVLVLRALRRSRVPYVLYSAQNIAKRYPVPFRWLERWALVHASAVVVCNEEAGRIVQRKGFPGVADVVPLGVDVEAFAPVEDAAGRGSAERVRVGYVGRLAEHKGVAVLLDAVAAEARLEATLIGAGPQEPELRHRVAAEAGLLERVTFHGPATPEELPGLLHALDALAVPSLTTPGWVEQFGRVVVEAMAAGVPVVVSDSGALPEVVGEAGLVVPEGDAPALAEALVRVGTDAELAARLREAGLVRAAECSWPAVARRYDGIYSRITRSVESASDGDPEVIVVAYHSEELLRAALAPLTALPVTVVDNSSSAAVRAVCDQLGVRYLDPGWNGGFAAGVNHGLTHRQRPGSDVLLLNPDASIDVQGVQELQRAMRSERDLASVAPAQVDGDGRPARVAWPFPGPVRSWVEAIGLGRINDRHEDYVIGSVLLLRAEALAHVGAFDDDFFLYAEETDWARRAARLGWRHRLVSEVTATHVGAATSIDSTRRDTHFHAGQERYLRKHHGEIGWSWRVPLSGRGPQPAPACSPRAAARPPGAELLRQGPRRVEASRYPRAVRP